MYRLGKQSSVSVFTSLLIAGLAACGGGGDSAVETEAESLPPPEPMVETKGIEGGGFVTQFADTNDALFVGDRQLDLSDPNLEITIDEMPGQIADLQVGQQISFSGTTADDGVTIVVSSIVQDDLIEGPVDNASINVAGQTFSVLGQRVIVTDLTVFDSSIPAGDLSGLNDGDFVEISGQIDGEGNILASRIEIEQDDDEFEITGVISSIDLAAQTLVIGNLTVDFSNAELDDFAGDPAVGDLIEVEGTQFDGAVLVATEIELENGDDFDGDEGDLAIVEGVITEINANNDFVVAGQTVVTSTATEFSDGTVANLIVGAFVEIEGSIQGDGTLLATEVDFETDDDVDTDFELTGSIDDIDSGAQTLVVLGVSVQISSATLLVANDNSQISFGDLSIGQIVDVDGFESAATAAGVLQAAKLEIEDTDEDDSVTGPVTAIAEPMLTIFGVTVATDGGTEFDEDMSAAEFFGSLSLGDFVEAEGQFAGGVLTATEIELEDDDD